MKLNYKRTMLIGFAFMSICAFWQLYDNEIPLILKNTFGMAETKTGVVMALDNILALFLLPLFGAFSDKTRTKIGRRMPFILIGTAMAVVSMMMIPVSVATKSLILFFIGLGFVLVCMGGYRSPAVALMPDLTPKPLRSKANAIINLMGTLGGIYTLVMTMLLSKSGQYGYFPLFLSVAMLMVVAVTILFFTIKENKIAEELAKDPASIETPEEIVEDTAAKEGITEKIKMPKDVFTSLTFLLASVTLWFIAYNAVTTAFSRYTEAVWGVKNQYSQYLMIATVAAVLSYFPIGIISTRIGRKKTILIGIAVMTVSFACAYFFVTPSPLMYVFFATTGIGWASINVNSYPMVVEMSRYSDIGRYTGIYYTFSMSAQILTPILSGFLIENISYRILFPYSAIFMALAFITMLFVRHGDAKPPVKANKLEYLDTDN
jgi:Na+/melibiose symporter-like transporter